MVKEAWIIKQKWGQFIYLPYFEKQRKGEDLEKAKDKEIKYSLIKSSKYPGELRGKEYLEDQKEAEQEIKNKVNR